MRKQLANIVTISRIVGSICLLCCPMFSLGFYSVYLFCGFTDTIDGIIARKLKIISEFGARLDSTADIVFVAVCFVKILPLIHLSVWIWLWIAIISTIKIGNILWVFIRSKRLVSIHTILNKATGFLLFLFPFTLGCIEPTYSSVIVCSLATMSAMNEVYYTSIDRNIFS